jgi:hypothetical protein
MCAIAPKEKTSTPQSKYHVPKNFDCIIEDKV